jgi:hypothetical protein
LVTKALLEMNEYKPGGRQLKIKELADEMQSGFLKARSIVENFAMAIEMIQYVQQQIKKSPIIVLKLDFHKAFDSIHWGAQSEPPWQLEGSLDLMG